MSLVSLLVQIIVLFLPKTLVLAIVPIDCTSTTSCTLQNYLGIWADRVPCRVADVEYPTTEEELVAAVAKAVMKKQKIKVVSRLSHSLPKFACPGGESGLLISTSKYNSRVQIDPVARTATADAGIELRDLLSRLKEKGLALPCTPYFDGLSLAGVVSTGAHGSSLQGKGGAVNEYVVGMSLVVPATQAEGFAKVVKLTADNDDLKAARLSLGVLGAISQVTLALEPLFKRSISKQAKDDSSLEQDVLDVGRMHTFGDITWYMNQRKIILRLDDKVSVDIPGEGRSTFATPTPASSVRQWRIDEEQVMSKTSSDVCARTQNSVDRRMSSGDGLVYKDGTFRGYPVVGFNNEMETGGGCQTAALNNSRNDKGELLTCAWDTDVPGQFYFHTSISIPLSRIQEAISDIKAIRDKAPEKLCALNLYGGATFRYVKGSTAYLASPDDSVFFEMLYFRDRRENTPRLNEDAVEEIEQLLLKKYNGRAHWGKNRDIAFQGIRGKTVNLAKFLEVRKRLDPMGLFSSEWSDAVLGAPKGTRQVMTYKDHCALEGLCICRRDSDCAPEKGYVCSRGAVYTEARVCKKL